MARSSLAVVCGTVVALIAAMSGTPSAGAAPWATSFSGECCYGQTMESGQRSAQWFRMINAGTEVWLPNEVNLGTLPRDSSSPFGDPSWSAPGRPATVTSLAVLPGEAETFRFVVTAPVVTSPTAYTGFFALLAENRTWMDSASGFGIDLSLPWTVLPAAPPSATVAAAPTSVTQGDPIVIKARANDNVDVDHVVVALDGGHAQTSAPSAPSDRSTHFETSWPTTATFDSTRLPPGPHELSVTAFDGIGLRDVEKTTVVVNQRPAPAVTSGAVSALGPTAATLTGTVTSNGAAATAHFEYGPTAAYGAQTADVALGPGTQPVPLTTPISDLVPGTTYHYRLVASNFGGSTAGSDMTFATPADPPPALPPAPTALAATHDFRVALAKKHGRIVAIIVTGAARRAKVRVTCVKACGKRGRLLAARTAKSKTVVLNLRGRDRLTSRARFTVTVRQKGHASRYRTYQVTARLPYSRVVKAGCRAVGGKVTRCIA